MKHVVVICILLMMAGRSYSQDSLVHGKIQTIAVNFARSGQALTSYKMLPRFIKDYLDGASHEKFRMSKKRFNASDAGGGPKRKFAYAVKLADDYILGYEHGGKGYHFHSLVFETNGKEVINLYPLATAVKLSTITELIKVIEAGNYRLYRNDF